VSCMRMERAEAHAHNEFCTSTRDSTGSKRTIEWSTKRIRGFEYDGQSLERSFTISLSSRTVARSSDAAIPSVTGGINNKV